MTQRLSMDLRAGMRGATALLLAAGLSLGSGATAQAPARRAAASSTSNAASTSEAASRSASEALSRITLEGRVLENGLRVTPLIEVSTNGSQGHGHQGDATVDGIP